MTSPDTQRFDQVSKQRIDYRELPGGGVRARLAVSLAGGKTYTFDETVTPEDVKTYEAQIAGAEIGYALNEIGYTGSPDEIGFLGGIVKAIGKGIKAVGKGVASVAKGVAKVGKAIVTSKVFQMAAKGLAVVAPVLGPLAPAALGAAGAMGVAGKLLGSKNAAKAGAMRTATALANSAVADAKKIAPNAAPSLLRIATDKANRAAQLAGTGAAPTIPSRKLTPAQAAALQPAGSFSPDTLQKAHATGRLYLLPASAAKAAA